MTIQDNIPKIKSSSRGKISPWISTVLILIYSVTVQFLLITSMEEAFSFVEDFFERMASSSIWSIGIPLPLIVALIFYFYGRQDKNTNLNLFIMSATALGTMLLGVSLYFIIDPLKYSPSSKTNFIFFSITIACSILFAFLGLIVKKIIVKRKSLL